MGLKVAVANGNWSSPSTWNGGVLPAAGDVVASNGFTVTIDQNINIDSLTNTAQTITSAVPAMTSNTTPSGIVSASGEWNTNNQGWQAFDRGGNGWLSGCCTPVSWLSYEFTSPKIITQYVMSGVTTATPKDFTFEAWNGSVWVILHTVTGNTNTTNYIGSFTNTVAYSRYRINITANNGNASYSGITELYLLVAGDSTVNAVAGGTFIVNSGVTVTCTNISNSIVAGSATCLTITATSPNVVTINTVIVYASQNINYSITKTGNCTLNFNGILDGNSNGALFIGNNTGTTNIVGTVRKTGSSISSNSILQLGTSNTLNLTGNITGNVTGGGSTKRTFISNGSSTITITGNIDGTPLNSTNDVVFLIGTNDIVNITGNVIGCLAAFGVCFAINAPNVCYIKIIGSLTAGAGVPAIVSTNAGSINILTGPFISHPTGIQPIYVTRMHYFRTMGSYYEFRDNSTNGALPPAASAPATRLVSPDTVVDAPIPANVRFGTVYASGSQTGTMKVPVAANVRLGVAVDNTTGTAVLTAADIWDYLRANMNTSGSIGERLKNASTVDSTGTQIASTAP